MPNLGMKKNICTISLCFIISMLCGCGIGILFFAKMELLTPSPITINTEWVSINPINPLEPIGSFSRILIDVSPLLKNTMDYKEMDKMFSGRIRGELTSIDGRIIKLNNFDLSPGSENAYIELYALNYIPDDTKYIKVRLKSEQNLFLVNVYWVNGSI